MNKNKKHFALGIAALFGLQAVYAGTMGDVNMFNPSVTAFAAIEGSLTWIKDTSKDSGDFTINTPVLMNGSPNTKTHANIGGGRLSGGLAYHYTPAVDLTLESGINYFGKISVVTVGNNQPIHFKLNSSFSGMDVLFGGAYKHPRLQQVEWFGKFGGLIVNTATKTKLATLPILLINGGTYSYGGSSSSTHVEFLPEIKFGANYNFTQNLALTLAYMHAFGASKIPTVNGFLTQTGAAGNTVLQMQTRSRVPSLNSALLGLRYNFA